MKPFSADDSVGLPHVKVGHCQAFILNQASVEFLSGLFCVRGLSATKRFDIVGFVIAPKASLRVQDEVVFGYEC